MSAKIELCAFLLVVVCSASTSAFFLSWGSPQPVKSQPQLPPQQQSQLPPQTLAYYQRVMQQQQPQYVDNNGVPIQPLQPIPAIPIQVPLQAQFAPAQAVHNVQLVPCLCPVSQDMEYVDNSAYSTPQSTPTTNQYQQPAQVQQLQQVQQVQQPIQQKQNP